MRVIEERVLEIVAEHLSLEAAEVSLDSRFTLDLGADDLDMVELVMVAEETFGIDGVIPDEEVERWLTVRDMVASVDKALAAGGSEHG